MSDFSSLKTYSEGVESQYESLKSDNIHVTQLNQSLYDEISILKQQLSISESEKSNLKTILTEFKEQSLKNEKQLKESFENIAIKILEDRAAKISLDGREQLKRSIEPLEKELEGFRKRVESIYMDETRERASLSKELQTLMKLNQQLSSEADTLARAIKGEHNPKLQGDWGEMILETILTNSGLNKGEHYFTQESSDDVDGERKRPDVIIRYPDSREVIIDSKVSLTAFSRYVSAVNDQERELALNSHIQSVKRHIDSLSSKNYDSRENSLDFVMMFMPIEPAYMLALSSEQGLWEYAYKRKIVIVSPTHLITALKLIYDLWSRDAQNKNAIDIAHRGALMYEKLVGFVTDMQAIGKSIDATQKSYDTALSKLSNGKGNLIRQAEILKELGVRSAKELNINSSEHTE